MNKLKREDYCISCEHVLEEKGFVFDNTPPFVAEPTSIHAKFCKNCKQLIEPKIEQIGSDYNTFVSALTNKKIKVVAFVAPSVRAGIGECFDLKEDCQHKIVTALKKLGCYNVFSMNFGADLTIMEESNELLERLSSGQNLPLLTSCCPSWVNYINKVYPILKQNLSTCKSPQQMMGAIINNYYTKVNKFENTDLFVASIVPCLAKKVERLRENVNSSTGYDVDACITTNELARLIKEKGIDFAKLKNSPFDSLFEQYSGSASAFGTAGGVSQAILKNIDPKTKVLKETKNKFIEKQYVVNGKKINVAQVEGLVNTKEIIENIIAGKCKFHLVEVMACSGGCIGGAGQPNNKDNLESRKQILLSCGANEKILNAKDNKIIKKLYETYLTEELSHNLLHEKRD